MDDCTRFLFKRSVLTNVRFGEHQSDRARGDLSALEENITAWSGKCSAVTLGLEFAYNSEHKTLHKHCVSTLYGSFGCVPSPIIVTWSGSDGISF